MKEKTGSKSSTPGFNHYMCGSKDETINMLDAFLWSSLVKIGRSVDMWQRIVDLLILKKAGNYDVTQMHTIQLFAAEFNMANKDADRKLMAQAEALGEVAPEQYGSRKKHKSINACLNNYDRIVHVVAILVMMSFGLIYKSAKVLFKTLPKADH